MKKILLSTLIIASVAVSAQAMAGGKKSSTALKVSSSGEAMHTKDKNKMNANRNLADAQSKKTKKVASR